MQTLIKLLETVHDLETLLRCAREEIRFLRKKCELVSILHITCEMWQTDNIRLNPSYAVGTMKTRFFPGKS